MHEDATTTLGLSDESRRGAVDDILAGYRARKIEQAQADEVAQAERALSGETVGEGGRNEEDDPTYCSDEFAYVARLGQAGLVLSFFCWGILGGALLSFGMGFYVLMVLLPVWAFSVLAWRRAVSTRHPLAQRHRSAVRFMWASGLATAGAIVVGFCLNWF